MSGLKHFSGFAVLAVVLATTPSSAFAGHRYGYFGSDGEVDLESLKGRLYYAPDEWKLHVRYDVEVEDAYCRDSFDLVLYVIDRGRPVLDSTGRPIQIVVPLDRPTEIDDDELEFEGRFVVGLPHCSDYTVPDLRLQGVVVRRSDGLRFDQKERRVRFRDRRPRSFHASFAFWN